MISPTTPPTTHQDYTFWMFDLRAIWGARVAARTSYWALEKQAIQ
jgi:hypothetical protein